MPREVWMRRGESWQDHRIISRYDALELRGLVWVRGFGIGDVWTSVECTLWRQE